MYRYSSKKFNSQLLALGIIRIGTLYDFRKSEHKKGISDCQEGKKVVAHTIEDLHVEDPKDHVCQDSKDFKSIEAFRYLKITGKNVTLNNVTFSKSLDSQNIFILCTSKICSRDTMMQFDEADSCLQIIHQNDFYNLLTETLNSIRTVEFKGCFEVKYQSREEAWNGKDWGTHSAVIKDPLFKKQAEIRAIWVPLSTEPPIEPIIIGNFRLGSFCRLITMW